jgi:hypothetical protein
MGTHWEKKKKNSGRTVGLRKREGGVARRKTQKKGTGPFRVNCGLRVEGGGVTRPEIFEERKNEFVDTKLALGLHARAMTSAICWFSPKKAKRPNSRQARALAAVRDACAASPANPPPANRAPAAADLCSSLTCTAREHGPDGATWVARYLSPNRLHGKRARDARARPYPRIMFPEAPPLLKRAHSYPVRGGDGGVPPAPLLIRLWRGAGRRNATPSEQPACAVPPPEGKTRPLTLH